MREQDFRTDGRSERDWHGQILAMSFEDAPCEGVLLRVSLPSGQTPPTTHAAGSLIVGLRECEPCQIEILNARHARLVIDDVEVRQDEHGRFAWTPTFFAGRVEIIVTIDQDNEIAFHAVVGPSTSKVIDEQFDAMIDEIRSFRAALLLGSSSATTAFGSEFGPYAFEGLVLLVRLKRYAPSFLRSLRAIRRMPHRSILHGEHRIPLARAKRLHPRALREPRIAAIVAGRAVEAAPLDSLQVATPTAVQTFDTPANRALKALAIRLNARITGLLESVRESRLEGDITEQELRRPRRARFLSGLLQELKPLLAQEPFSSVLRVETSAASLTQISAQPLYSSAYRQGNQALLRGVDGANDQSHLYVSPTWGVYETWCFAHLLGMVAQSLGQSGWRILRSGIVSAAESYELTLADGSLIEAHFQANFRSSHPEAGRQGWSLSRSRIPDIVFVLKREGACSFLVLDAKYRRHRENVLEAMESAHIYHDSLRVDLKRADFCALLLPAEPDVPHLEHEDFLIEHGVGTFSQFAPGAQGVERCVDFLIAWIMKGGRNDAVVKS
ncbi:DUF2357 domain-containing protein [Paraburkholderia caribensis]|uniref:DUF2357 domain-containing protein n=1 Tax=Paraburkholderia caribensis TaxID=75105 RepID=UPI002856C49A|nr:DUF2357 domain-containing protein [Paraburkholderia caribensis]MDR6379663.1 hypothetical protein [Paraburkholderia caribensis]